MIGRPRPKKPRERMRAWMDIDPSSTYPAIEAVVSHYLDLEKATTGCFRATIRSGSMKVPYIVIFEYLRHNGTYAIWVPMLADTNIMIRSCRVLPSFMVVPGSTNFGVEQQKFYYRLAELYDEWMPATGVQRFKIHFKPDVNATDRYTVYCSGVSPFDGKVLREVKGFQSLALASSYLELYRFIDHEAKDGPNFEFMLFKNEENERFEHVVPRHLPNVEFLVRVAWTICSGWGRLEANKFIVRFISYVYGGCDVEESPTGSC